MSVEALSERDVQSIVRYWCNGATDTEIAKWTESDRPTVLLALSKVAVANDLMCQKDLRDYDADDLLEGYERYAQETAGKPDNDTRCQSREDRYGNSYASLQESSRQFLALLERHHGKGTRAVG